MLRRTCFALGVMALVGSAVLAFGQDQRRGPSRGPAGGGSFFGGFGGTSRLLGVAEVQSELGMSDEQKGLIQDMLADLRQQQGGGFQGFQNLTEEERQKRFEEGRKKWEETARKTDEMTKMILEPKQYERLQQLQLQSEGPMALARPDMADKLGLSQEQRDKVREIMESARPDRSSFANWQDMSDAEREQARTKMRERFEKTRSDLTAVLIAAQKETWSKMQGKKFDFPQPNFAGRPGGDGRRDRGAARKNSE